MGTDCSHVFCQECGRNMLEDVSIYFVNGSYMCGGCHARFNAARDCKHGQLARSCEICELEAERDEARKWNAALQRSFDKVCAERDALKAENERLRAFAQWVAAGEPSPAEYDPSADGRDEALSSGNSGDSELYGVLTVYYNMAQKAKAALQGEE